MCRTSTANQEERTLCQAKRVRARVGLGFGLGLGGERCEVHSMHIQNIQNIHMDTTCAFDKVPKIAV